MKIALVQTNPVIGDFAGNTDRIISRAAEARAAGCDLVIFPELAVCGYPPQDLLERPAFIRDHHAAFASLVKRVSGIAVICGHLESHTGSYGKPLHNSASLFAGGRILATARKRLLPTYDVFDEARYFEPGGAAAIFEYKELRFGITICEDVWNDKGSFPERLYAVDPVADLVSGSVVEAGRPDFLVNISASPFQIGKDALKMAMFSRVSTNHSLPLLYVNQVGGQDSLLFDGGSMVMDAAGRVVARAARFREELLVVETADWQTDTVVAAGGDTEEAGSIAAAEIADVYQALVMGVRDYAGKCGFSAAVIGLSGGIDSAVTAAVACRALGHDRVLGVALPSPYSSPESVEDARQLADNLDCGFTMIPITGVFEEMLATLKPQFAGLGTDVTEQNLQARIRGNLLMALSNKFGSLLLTTGNKSEMAVGYCTLYGDMSGGLAVIADVPKVLVYRLAHYINRDREIIPTRVIAKKPSAELAPNQFDQDDLPPYDILDPILAAYLEENCSVEQIVRRGFERAVVEDVVRRVTVNEYKRKQAPIGLKITTKAFGYGRRYPTAQNYREQDLG